MPTDTDIAWAAGLFEGEGCLRIKTVGNGRYAFAQLSMSDQDAVERFQAIVGVGTVNKRTPPSWGNWKPQWAWATTNRADFAVVADLLRPWLMERRLAKLNEVERERTPEIKKSSRRTMKPISEGDV